MPPKAHGSGAKISVTFENRSVGRWRGKDLVEAADGTPREPTRQPS